MSTEKGSHIMAIFRPITDPAKDKKEHPGAGKLKRAYSYCFGMCFRIAQVK